MSSSAYRFTAIVTGLFFLGHTFGAVIKIPYFGAPAAAVEKSMEAVTFPCNTAVCTWFGFYRGFGAGVSVFFLFAAFLMWFLGGLQYETRTALRPVVIALIVSFIAFGAICKTFFFLAPTLFCGVIVVGLVACMALDVQRSAEAPRLKATAR